MGRWTAVFVLALLERAAGAAPAVRVEGTVTAARARWTTDGSRIVTDAVLRSPDGTTVTVSQLGGHVDGLTMRDMTGPPLLRPGMRVVVGGHLAPTGSRLIVDDVVSEAGDGFVRSGPTEDGKPLAWPGSSTTIAIATEGTAQIAGDDEVAIVAAVLANWTTSTASCSYFDVRAASATDREVGNDGVNLIKFRDTRWCRPATDDNPERCYTPGAAGKTTLTYVDEVGDPDDGMIVDADIELNGVDFAISADGATLGTAACQMELANTLTHELGHLLGLEHTCRVGGDPRWIDGDGDEVPLCGDVFGGPRFEATMYPFQDCESTSQVSLTADDILGACLIYPLARDPDKDDGCCQAGGSPAQAALLAVVSLGLVRPRRRRA